MKRWIECMERLKEQKSLNDYLMEKVALLVEIELNKDLFVGAIFYKVTIIRDGAVKKIRIFREKEGRSGFRVYFILDTSDGRVYKALERSKYLEDDQTYAEWYKQVKHTLSDLFSGFRVIETEH